MNHHKCKCEVHSFHFIMWGFSHSMEKNKQMTYLELTCHVTPIVTTCVDTSLNAKHKALFFLLEKAHKKYPKNVTEVWHCAFNRGNKPVMQNPNSVTGFSSRTSFVFIYSISPLNPWWNQVSNLKTMWLKHDGKKKIKMLKTIKQRQKLMIDNNNNTSFPSKDCHRGRRGSFTVCTLPSSNTSKASVEPLRRRAADSEWPVTATQTEHAKPRQWPRKPNGVLLTSEREFSSPRAPVRQEESPADCRSSHRCPTGFLSQSTSP